MAQVVLQVHQHWNSGAISASGAIMRHVAVGPNDEIVMMKSIAWGGRAYQL
jgi:hypothetical protein